VRHCTTGLALGWASNDEGSPDVVMACAGDVPTLETLALFPVRHDLPDPPHTGRECRGPDDLAAGIDTRTVWR